LEIASPKNPRVKALAALKERKERERAGLFLVEGRREVERALAAGLKPVTVLLGPRATPAEEALAQGEVLRLSEEALKRVSSRENPAQVIAVFPIPRRELKEVRLPQDPLVLVLLGLEKPGNLGAILRSADGAGAHLVLVAEGVDLYSPQVIRNSTGVVFSLPVFPVAEEEAARFLEEKGLYPVAATPRGKGSTGKRTTAGAWPSSWGPRTGACPRPGLSGPRPGCGSPCGGGRTASTWR
jgi:TrmH family RNA methyltransferase